MRPKTFKRAITFNFTLTPDINQTISGAMLNIIRTNGTQYELPRNTLEKIVEQESCEQPATAFGKRNISVFSLPPPKRFKADNTARDQYLAAGMSAIEVLESAKCVVCHDVYEQTILEQSCEQALCLHCYEQVVKNECPACKSEIQLTRLSRDSAKTVTRAIIECNLRGGIKSAEARASADQHKEFYAGRYQLRDLATFNNNSDLAYLSDATVSDVNSHSETDESNTSTECGHEEKCISETQSHSSLSPGEDTRFSDTDNESSEFESDNYLSDSEPDDYSLSVDSNDYWSDSEQDDYSLSVDSNDYWSDSETDDFSLSLDSNDYLSDGEPDDYPSQSNAAETDGSMQLLNSIREFLSGVLSSVSRFVSKQLGNSN